MLMIPISFLPAAVLVGAAAWLALRLNERMAAPLMIAFLGALALQLVLLGARYGYGLEAVLKVQHITGACIPPLAYLAFTGPVWSWRVGLHTLGVLMIALVVVFAIGLADAALGLLTWSYAVALVLALRLRGDDLFAWAPLRYAPSLRLGLYGAVAALALSGVTDLGIAADFLITGGVQTATIAAVASLGSLAILAASTVFVLRFGARKEARGGSDADGALALKLKAEIAGRELYRDPDLTLSRLSKRLGLPARDISQAVNASTGQNMSQFINSMRIEAACAMLKRSDVTITTAMLEAGFYTKSNFNREFRRVTGLTPTEWRSRSAGANT